MSHLPLTNIALPVPFASIQAEHVPAAIDALIRSADERLQSIAQLGSASESLTYAGTLGALDDATEELEYATSLVSHLEATLGSPELRDAYTAVLPQVSAFYTGITLSEPLYATLRAFAASPTGKTLGSDQARHLDKTLAEFRRSGAELSAADKDRLRSIDISLAEYTLAFSQKVVDATAAFELVIDDSTPGARDLVAGLPDGVLSAARASAASKNLNGYRFTLQAPSYGPVMSFAHSRELREKMYRAHVTRASGADGNAAYDNRQLVSDILRLRREKARLLGFAHFADLVTNDRMAKSGAQALEFVEMLEARLRPTFERENAALAAYAASRGHTGSLEPWDIAYYAEMQRRDNYDFDEETIRPYFPLGPVTQGMFDIATRLYGVVIERDPAAPVWHSDVSAWTVTDGNGRRLGGFYLDLFPRETKRDGAWMAGIVDRLPSTQRERENIAVIVGNMSPPRAPGQPALLSHREVETLFHEFGHMMHHVLSEVPIRSMAGTRVASDFVELPSMIMENWCWAPEALDRFARHHESGSPLPSHVRERMLAARTYRAANALMRQVGFSTVDLMLHTAYDPAIHGDVLDYARTLFARFSPAPLPGDYAMLTSFSHLFSSPVGYAAGYYSYQWSEVLQADAFVEFETHGVLNSAVGDRFRRTILARGDTRDPGELYREFLGRDPDVSALMTRLGMTS